MKASSVWCAVGGGGGVSLYPNYTQSLDGKKKGKVSGKDLPWQGANPRMFAQLGFVCVCVCVWCESTQPHTHIHTNRQRFRRSIQWTHAAPTHTLSLKVLFILVTGCGSGVILLQYWVTTTTLMPPFKFNSWPNFCCLAPQMGAPALMRQQESCLRL